MVFLVMFNHAFYRITKQYLTQSWNYYRMLSVVFFLRFFVMLLTAKSKKFLSSKSTMTNTKWTLSKAFSCLLQNGLMMVSKILYNHAFNSIMQQFLTYIISSKRIMTYLKGKKYRLLSATLQDMFTENNGFRIVISVIF